jgi:hypothetical protein
MPDKYNTITSDKPRSHVAYSAVTITTASGLVNYDVQAETSLFDRITQAREFVLRTTKPTNVKLNEITNDEITLFSNEGLNMAGIPISNVYLDCDPNAVIRIWIVGWN